MRKKIIGIFVILLLIATALPVSGSLQVREQTNTLKKEILYHLDFGYIQANKKINYVEQEDGITFFYINDCLNIRFIGFGTITYDDDNVSGFQLIIRNLQEPNAMAGFIFKEINKTEDYINLKGFVINFHVGPHIGTLYHFYVQGYIEGKKKLKGREGFNIKKTEHWYWIKSDTIEDKTFGKILQDITSRVFLVFLCKVNEDNKPELVDRYSVCKIAEIEEELTSEEFGEYAFVFEFTYFN